MGFEDLGEWTKQIGARRKLPASSRQKAAAELPGFIRELNSASAPKRIQLPTGESLADATRMTALKCHCLLLARSVIGVNYVKADPEYERLSKDVLFWVMRHHFNTADPKGVFCCAPCTLSLLPLYSLDCFRWVNCEELEANVLDSLEKGCSVFKSAYPKAYAGWATSMANARRSARRV